MRIAALFSGVVFSLASIYYAIQGDTTNSLLSAVVAWLGYTLNSIEGIKENHENSKHR